MAFDNPHGFTSVGGPSNVRPWTVKAATTISIGDLVVTTISEGTITRAVADQDESTGTWIVGVALHGAAAGEECAIETHPERVYQVQGDTATWAATMKGEALDVKVGAGGTQLGASTMEVDSVTGSVSGCCYLIDKVDGPDIGGGTNDYGTNTELIVSLRLAAMLQTGAGT